MAREKQLRVTGHTLRYEGRVPGAHWPGNGEGQCLCSCGERSVNLPSTAARQRWHKKHKQAVMAERETR